MTIPDAPWIREAERRGTDYMYEWIWGEPVNSDEDPEDEDDD